MLPLSSYEPLIDRHSSTCTWPQFCEKLYEALWRRAEGYTSSADLLHELYVSSKICGTVVSLQRGFPCFEEMLNSNLLEHVVTIERFPAKDSRFITYRYRASLTNQFQDIRRRVRQRRKDVYILSSMEQETSTSEVKTEEEGQFFNFQEESTSKDDLTSDFENFKLFECEDESYSESVEENKKRFKCGKGDVPKCHKNKV